MADHVFRSPTMDKVLRKQKCIFIYRRTIPEACRGLKKDRKGGYHGKSMVERKCGLSNLSKKL